jgi:hypothetical protein
VVTAGAGILAALIGFGCQGNSSDPAPRVDKAATHDAAISHGGFGGHDGGTPDDAEVRVDAPKVDEPEPAPDPGKRIIELGAIPAWQAVVDRTQYLARRGQHGVVYGTIGSAAEPYVWLVDDTEGNGALGIKALLNGKAAKEGDRVALGGAWKLDDDRHWFWAVDTLSSLPAAAPSESRDPRPAVPGHVIANGELPAGARTISLAKDGDAVYFTVIGAPPVVDGDGWQVADELGNPVAAVMTMPGERPTYGGQDMRAPDERWLLRRGQTYWVRAGRFHKHGPDKPATVTARTAPVRVK